MGGFFAGLTNEIGDSLHRRHVEDFQDAVTSKQNLMDAYKTLRDDPHMQDLWGDMAQKQLQAASTDPRQFMKGKIPKELDPTEYMKLHSQRASGQVASPANAGQNGTMVPPPPVGQAQGGPAGQGMQLPSWNAATSGTNAASQGAVPPPPSPGGAGPSSDSTTGAGAGIGASAGVSASPTMGTVGPIIPPPVAALAGGQAAMSHQALPPDPAAGGAPDSITAVGPQQAAAIPPPPPAPMNGQPQMAQDQNSHILNPFELANRQADLSVIPLKKKLEVVEPYLKGLDPQLANIMRMEIMQGGNGSAGTSALLNIAFGAPQKEQIDATGMDPEQKAQYGLPPNAAGKWTALRTRTGQTVGAYQGWAGTTNTTSATGVQGKESTNQVLGDGGMATAVGGGPSTVLAPQGTTWVESDPAHPELEYPMTKNRAGQLVAATEANGQPVPSRLKASVLQHQTSTDMTTDASGHTTGTRTNGVVVPPPPGAVANAPKPKGGGGAGGTRSSATPAGGPAVDPAIKRWAEDKAAGKTPVIPAKSQAEVTRYMVAHGMDSPTPLSAKGQADIAAIDPVLIQINDAMKQLKDEKLDQNNNILSLVPEYLQYTHGLSVPHSNLFTNLSFEQVRSAAAALKGLNSRAFPILNRALQHTPTLDRMGGLDPDSTKAMYGKLMEMKTLLQQGRNSILADEKKSGVIGAPDQGNNAGGAIAPPPAASSSGMIDVISPEGVAGQIPADKWQAAQARGFKRK